MICPIHEEYLVKMQKLPGKPNTWLLVCPKHKCNYTTQEEE